MWGMLRELDDKRGELGQKSLGLKDGPREQNAEASKWAARRNELNRATEQLIDTAQDFKKLRDECNKNVAQSKRKRDECNEKVSQLYQKIDSIRKQHNNHRAGERSITDLRREIDYLEFRQQTEVLSPDKEKQLVNKIAALQAEFNGRKEELEKTGEMKSLLDEAQSLRDQASSYHDKVINFAEMAQECHDQMISNFKEADQTRAEADAAQREFLKALQ